MSTSKHPTSQYFANEFTVSSGSIPFRRAVHSISPNSSQSGWEICILYHRPGAEWLLPKGRKEPGETIQETAVRETYEETGYRCKLLLELEKSTEPIAVTIRHLKENNVKIIWWFVSIVEEGTTKQLNTQMANEDFVSEFMPAEEAIAKLTFQGDRDLAAKALEYVRVSYTA